MPARLDSYRKSNNILCTNQFGFCKNSNTSDAIIEFLDYVYSSLNSKWSTIAVHQDFSKAFDTVNHNIFMSKLLHNGVRGVMQHWFEKTFLLQENFPTHTQVWNCLNHRNDCRQRGLILVTYRCYNSNPY